MACPVVTDVRPRHARGAGHEWVRGVYGREVKYFDVTYGPFRLSGGRRMGGICVYHNTSARGLPINIGFRVGGRNVSCTVDLKMFTERISSACNERKSRGRSGPVFADRVIYWRRGI